MDLFFFFNRVGLLTRQPGNSRWQNWKRGPSARVKETQRMGKRCPIPADIRFCPYFASLCFCFPFISKLGYCWRGFVFLLSILFWLNPTSSSKKHALSVLKHCLSTLACCQFIFEARVPFPSSRLEELALLWLGSVFVPPSVQVSGPPVEILNVWHTLLFIVVSLPV